MPKYIVTYTSTHTREFNVPDLSYILTILGDPAQFKILKIVDEHNQIVLDNSEDNQL